MELEHRFTVPVPLDVAWAALLDPQRVAPCFPGATLDAVDGTSFTGTVKVRIGPITLLYKGKGNFAQVDEQARRAVIEASGKDSRGNGTASAVVTASLSPDADGTAVDMVTDLTITGRPAQLSRGMIADVSRKIVAAFADCLAGQLGDQPATDQPATGQQPGSPMPSEPAAPTAPVAPTAPATPTAPVAPIAPSAPVADSEINLLEVAGPSVLKRLAPLLLGAVAVVLVLRRLRRRH